MTSVRVVNALDHLGETRGFPQSIRVDNGPEYTADILQCWSEDKGIHLDFIDPGKPTQNGFVESFNGKFREECLNQHLFLSRQEAQKIVDEWRSWYNTVRPRSLLAYETREEYSQRGK